MNVTFVIPARDEADRIGSCIDSVLKCERDDVGVTIVVVDNGSSDGTAEVARSRGARVVEISDGHVSALRNAGVAATSDPLVAFIDADVLVSHDWIECALRTMEESGAAMVGSSPGIPEDATWVTRAWHLHVALRPDYGRRPWLASMNVLVRRDAFETVGGFDESLETCEDVDFGYRLGERHVIQSDRRIKAIHLGEARTLGELFGKETWRGRAGIRGAVGHGFVWSEIPSLAQPIVCLIALIGTAFALVVGETAVAAAFLLLFFAYPLARSLTVSWKRRSAKNFFEQFVIWTVYSLARVKSLLLEASTFHRPADRRKDGRALRNRVEEDRSRETESPVDGDG